MRIDPKRPTADPDTREQEWCRYMRESNWSSSVDMADVRFLAEFSHLIDRYTRGKKPAILEWGSGVTTRALLALGEKRDSDLLVTIDHSTDYLEEVLAFLPPPQLRLEAHAIDLVGEVDDYGASPASHYATFPFGFGRRFDLIFIDGRRRNECLLAAAMLQEDDGVVLMHDYRRARYRLGSALFDVVEDFYSFRVLRRRADMAEAMRAGFQELTGLFDQAEGGAAYPAAETPDAE